MINTTADYEAALAELERVWGAKLGTPESDRLNVLAMLIESYILRIQTLSDGPAKSHRSDEVSHRATRIT
jgi:antitoxin component HigA of HigAB toxin-antitoxin module